MGLSSIQLDAFIEVAKAQSFSKAALRLNITQSALSQRILNLESELGSTLILRGKSTISLTELGENLLRYCQMKNSLEEEFFSQNNITNSSTLSGVIKVGGFSSVVRSLLIPTISTILLNNPEIQTEIITREVNELPQCLDSGQVDFILLNRRYDKKGIENIELGFEENVLVEPKKINFRKGVFLDHDLDDSTTVDFFKKQENSKRIIKWKKSYFDEIYSIIDGVLSGAGSAVIPLHLVREFKNLKINKCYRSYKTPVYFCYYQQSYYTMLQKRVIEEVTTKIPKLLTS